MLAEQDNVAAFVHYIFYGIVGLSVFAVHIAEQGSLGGRTGSGHDVGDG